MFDFQAALTSRSPNEFFRTNFFVIDRVSVAILYTLR